VASATDTDTTFTDKRDVKVYKIIRIGTQACPDGTHLPADEEWTVLSAGCCCGWWSATKFDAVFAWNRFMRCNDEYVYRDRMRILR